MKPFVEKIGGIAPRAFLIVAVTANAGIAVAKIIVYAITGSASMLAESIHSMADTCKELLMMWGGRRARRPADAAFSCGYARERYFWSFMVAVLFFTLGGLYSILDGTSKLRGGHDVVNPTWSIAVILFAAGLEGSSLRVAIKIARPHAGKDGWRHFIRTTKSPEAPVVLLEDTAALIGLSPAFLGLGLTIVTGDPLFDAIGSIALGLLLTGVAGVLAIEMEGLLIGESASQPTSRAIRAALDQQAEIRGLSSFVPSISGPRPCWWLPRWCLPPISHLPQRHRLSTRSRSRSSLWCPPFDTSILNPTRPGVLVKGQWTHRGSRGMPCCWNPKASRCGAPSN